MDKTIKSSLTSAYRQLGIQDAEELDCCVEAALAYLSADREHYIEVVDRDTPEYLITTRNGVICKLIPLAQQITEDARKDHIRKQVCILSLMVTSQEIRFVHSSSYVKLYPDPLNNAYSYPVYRYIALKDLQAQLQFLPPEEIRPLSTEKDQKILSGIYKVFEQLCQNACINTIPHKAERAMMAAQCAICEEFTVQNHTVSGKLVPLAYQEPLWDDYREDHRYNYRMQLCLLITEDEIRYLMRKRHHYHYFRRVIVDDTPGGCIYEPTEDKQEITYEYMDLADIPQDMHPLFY